MSITTPAWVRDAIFYQVFPDRFAISGRVDQPGDLEPWDAPVTVHGFKGGDLFGVADRLPYLADLGITAIYLNPIFSSASNHRYHTYDYFSVDPLLGGDEALRELLDRAHAMGIRVILDGVFNHASRGFWPFNHVLECGLSSPYVDWFHVDREALASGRPLRAYPDESLRHALAQAGEADRFGSEFVSGLGYKAWWDIPALPKLNTDNPKVRDYLMRVAEHWIRFGADGWRLDVAAEIDDDEFWREFRRRVKAIDPEAYIVAEVWVEDHRWLQGDQFDAYMNYPLGLAILGFAAGSHRNDDAIAGHGDVHSGVRFDDGATFLDRVAHQLRLYDPAITAVQLNLLGSHDMPRILTICGGDRDAVRMATLVQLTLPGAPCIYYGDEIGMAGGHDPYCRGAFPTDEAEWDHELRAYVRGLARLRHEHPVLRHGAWSRAGSAGYLAAYARHHEAATWIVAVNAAEEPGRIEVAVPGPWEGSLEPVITDGWTWPPGQPVAIADGRAWVELPARSARLLRRA